MKEKFLKHCKAKGLSERTIKSYENALKILDKYLEDKNANLKTIDIDDLTLYISEGNRKPTTVRTTLGSIRVYLYYLMKKGEIDRQTFNLPKAERVIKDIYTEDELKALLKKPKKKEGFNVFKIWVLVNYLLGTGNRIGSCLEIQMRDIDLDSNCITLRKTKQKKQQVIPITSKLVEILSEYIEVRGGCEEDYLFCNSYGDKSDLRTIQQMIRNYNLSRDVEKTSAHLFRHTFATMFIRNGGDVYRLSKLLGHSSLVVTENYIQGLPIQDLYKNEKMNPLESLSKTKIRW